MKMRKGFTLIELSIVLIIIGLIIGAVIKGKDLINSSNQKKIYNTWVKEWQIAANTYQDRTGSVLADSNTSGGTATEEDGYFDNVDLSTTTSVQEVLKKVGLDVPLGNVPSKNGGAYSIKGKHITSEAQIHLVALSATGNNKNYLQINNLPTDVAIAFDTITDGKLDPQGGSFLGWDGSALLTEWPDVETTATVTVLLEM